MNNNNTKEYKELDIKITVGAYKSQIKNKELALKLFDSALDELVK